MKLLTFCSFKGGAGKTTALMGLCAAFASDGKRLALFDADENRPLTRWERETALRSNTWGSFCEVYAAEEMALLEAAYEDAGTSRDLIMRWPIRMVVRANSTTRSLPAQTCF